MAYNVKVGQKFGRLKLLKFIENKYTKNKKKDEIWECLCDCGNTCKRNIKSLIYSKTISSCGCYLKELYIKRRHLPEKYIGKKYGSLTILNVDYSNSRTTKFLCVCDCGTKKVINKQCILSGEIKSCGCMQKKRNHNFSKTKIYRTWARMKQRCFNPNSPNYNRYGGRGIIVCNEWKDNCQAFYEWSLKNGYKEGLSIDRINNDGNYEPSNCRWATTHEQNLNTSRNKKYNGKTIYEISVEKNIPYGLAYRKVKRGEYNERV